MTINRLLPYFTVGTFAAQSTTLRLTGILSALLLASAARSGAQVAEPSTLSSSIVAKPLFALTPAKLVAPSKDAYTMLCLGSDPNGKFLFQAESEDSRQGPLFVIVDPKTGIPIKRISTAPKPKETVEWISESRWLPDGRFLYVGVTRGVLKDGEGKSQGKVNVGVSLRIINTVNGTVSERLIPFDDPSGEGMSKGFCSWSGSGCVEGKASEGRLLLSNSYFTAELNLDSLKTLRTAKNPDIKGFYTPGDYLVKNGRLWEIQIAGGAKYFITEFDKMPRELNEEEFKLLRESKKIEDVPHAKTEEIEFVAHVEKGREEKGQKEEGRRGFNGSFRRSEDKLLIAYNKDKTLEVKLGAINADCTTSVFRCGLKLLIYVYAPENVKGPRQRGLIVVACPLD